MSNRLRFSVLFIYILLSVFVYRETGSAKFVADFIDIYNETDFSGWLSFFNIIKGVHTDVVSRGILFLGVKFLGLNPVSWMIFTSILHALNAWLLFLFIRNLLKLSDINNSHTISFLVCLVYLLSPYHTEVVVWLGAFNYLVVSFFIFLSFLFAVTYITKGLRILLAGLFISALGAAFSHELAIIILPAVLVIFAINKETFKPKRLLYSLTASGIPVLFYFASNRIFKNDWIGHYGAATHLSFHWEQVIVLLNQYIVKILLLTPFMPADWQKKIFASLVSDSGLYASIAIYFLAACYALYRRLRYGHLPLVFVGFAFFFFSVFPVLNLYFPDFIKIHADRYCYTPSSFLILSAVLPFFLFHKVAGMTVALCATVVNWAALSYNVQSWQMAGLLEKKLESNFIWQHHPHVYILNLPENFRGAYMYRSLGESKFAVRYNLVNKESITANITEIAGYNMMSTEDSVRVSVIDSNTLHVELSEWGRWYWRATVGASSYETDLVKVDMDEWRHSYKVRFKARKPEDVVIYQKGGSWGVVEDF